MTSSTVLRLDHLKLRNFRCFSECEIDLHPELTVLVAENGQGKTALLDAIAVALEPFINTITDQHKFRGFNSTDIRRVKDEIGRMAPSLPLTLEAEGCVSGTMIHWSYVRKGESKRSPTTQRAERFYQAAQKLRENIERDAEERSENQPLLPLVAFYGTSRLWSGQLTAKGNKAYFLISRGRPSGYIDCLSSSSSFKGVSDWYGNKVTEVRDPRFKVENRRNLNLLTAVREATRVVLEPTGWCILDWDFEGQSLVVEHPEQGRLPLAELSDGVRNMIALTADIARRCAALNPHLEEKAATNTPGVLLIDEVDMHLHPRWQQLLVQLLQKAFPSLQMILSTHSPHVLSTVNKESIRVIRLLDGQGLIETPKFQTRGVESADVLAAIMGVDPVPQIEEAQLLKCYRKLIESGNADDPEARTLRSTLVEHFGEEHPLILDCDRLIRFQAFRLKRNPPKES